MTASLGPCMDGMLCDQRQALGYHSTDRYTNLSPPSLSLDSSAEPQDWGNLQPQPWQAPLPPTSFLGHAPFRAPPSCSFAKPCLISVAPPLAPLTTPPHIGSSLGGFPSLSTQASLPPINPALSWLLPLFLRPLYFSSWWSFPQLPCPHPLTFFSSSLFQAVPVLQPTTILFPLHPS